MRRPYTVLLDDEVADALLCAVVQRGLLTLEGARPVCTVDRITSAGVELAREVQRDREAQMQARRTC